MNEVLGNFIKKNSDTADTYYDIIADMLGDSCYEYARDTLEGIQQTISETNTVTAGQIEAVKNIRAKPSEINWDTGEPF